MHQSNYFIRFGIETKFDVNLTSLTETFRNLQISVHPDRFAAASDAEKRVAMEKATEVNEAYQTLRDPVRRAMYLLWLKDVNGMDEKNTSMPHAFLMEQIEWREAIADAKLKEDTDRLEEMMTELQSIIESMGSIFSAAYEGGHLATATTLARKMRFMQKLIEEVEQSLAEID